MAPSGTQSGPAGEEHAELARREGQLTLLEVNGLSVDFVLGGGSVVHAVRDVDLKLEPGGRLGLVGESGCGKTTTMLALMGLLPPSASVDGMVKLEGFDVLAGGESSARKSRWRDIAMVFQGAMNAFSPVKRIGAQIVEPMKLHGVNEGKAAWKRAEALLERVGIPAAAARRYPHEFSGGMRQRAGIAMALACNPKILLADEPTTGLDVIVQARILALLKELSEEMGLALILVTHDLPVVAQVCERVAVMYAGAVVEQAPIRDLVAEQRHPYSQVLFSSTLDVFTKERPTPAHGVPPRLDIIPTGCPFHPRCAFVMKRCTHEVPELKEVGHQRSAACHLNDLAEQPQKSAASSC